MIVLIINGAPRSGKDTFIEFLKDTHCTVMAYSSIDWVKSKAKLLGWDGVKDAAGRKFLSDIKDATTDYNDKPFKEIIFKLNSAHRVGFDFFAVNIRESSEIQKLASYCDNINIPCHTVRIQNQKAEQGAKNLDYTGDNQYADYDYDATIPNNGTLDGFRKKVEIFVAELLADSLKEVV